MFLFQIALLRYFFSKLKYRRKLKRIRRSWYFIMWSRLSFVLLFSKYCPLCRLFDMDESGEGQGNLINFLPKHEVVKTVTLFSCSEELKQLPLYYCLLCDQVARVLATVMMRMCTQCWRRTGPRLTRRSTSWCWSTGMIYLYHGWSRTLEQRNIFQDEADCDV